MKRIISILIGVCILTLSSVSISKAQVNISVNIGTQPLWGPTGYDVAEYYYLPDLQMYYYVPSRQFIYLSNGRWQFASNLPARYRGYDLYSGYKVVINEPKPYRHFNQHKVNYVRYKGWRGKQVIIRDSKDPKYHVVKGHPGNPNGHYKQRGPGNRGGNNGQGPGHAPGNSGGNKGQGQGPGHAPGNNGGNKGQGQSPVPDHGGGKGNKKGN